MKTIMDNRLTIEECLPSTDYQSASITLAEALLNNQFNKIEELLNEEAILVLHEARSIWGKKEIIAYWKDWLYRLTKDNLDVKYEVKFCANTLRAALSIRISGYKQMYVLFRIHEGKICNMVLAGNPLQDPLIRYEDLDKLPYTTDFIISHAIDKDTPEANRMPCLSCGKASEELDWYKVQINKGMLGYLGQAIVCPICNKVVEYYPNQLLRYESPVNDITSCIEKKKTVPRISPKGLVVFYNDTPLKDTSYTNSLPEDQVYELDFTYGLKDSDYEPSTVKEIAEESKWLFISKIQTENETQYEKIKQCYKTALDDGIIEAANNLAILVYNYDGNTEEAIELFKTAIAGGSTNAMINLYTVLWGESRYAEAINYLMELSNIENPSLRCLWNLAVLYYYGADYKNNPLEKDIESSKNYLRRIISSDIRDENKDELSIIEEAKYLLSNIDTFNIYSQKGKEFYNSRISSVVNTKDIKNKSEVFSTLTSIYPDKGWYLGLKLANMQSESTGDESNFYFFNEENKIEKSLLKHINVTPSEMGIWELYLLMSSSTVMPTFWHGGYIERKYIFSEEDIEDIEPLKGKDLSTLINDKMLFPVIEVEKSRDLSFPLVEDQFIGNIYCCYWNEWKGLVREHIRVKITGNKVVEYENIDSFVFHEYDCGIFF